MAISSGKDPFWTAKRGIVQNGLVLNLDAAVTQSYPGTGTVWRDLSGLNNHGTLTNGPVYNRNNGGNIELDGVNDQINFQSNLGINGSNQQTICHWFRRQSTSTKHYLGYFTNDVFGFSLSGTILLFHGSAGGYGSIWNLTFQTWSNIVLRYDGTQPNNLTRLQVFINGVAPIPYGYSGTVPSSIGSDLGNFLIGYRPASGYGTGQVANVSVYNRALSASEIAQNFNVTRNRFGV